MFPRRQRNRYQPGRALVVLRADAAHGGGLYRDVPDLSLTCDDVRISENHVLFLWTFTGHDAATGNALKIHGWEEWDLNADLKVQASRGWFDADAYARQAGGGA